MVNKDDRWLYLLQLDQRVHWGGQEIIDPQDLQTSVSVDKMAYQKMWVAVYGKHQPFLVMDSEIEP